MFKIYAKPPAGLSRAMNRVYDAMVENRPVDVQFVDVQADADLVILHVIGYPETVDAIEGCRLLKQRYGMIMYCLRSTQKPSTADWIDLWREAAVVWSYYDLPALVQQDSIDYPGLEFTGINFYHSPLGVDQMMFRPNATKKRYKAFSSGTVADSESLEEIFQALALSENKGFHLGPPRLETARTEDGNMDVPDNVVCKQDIADDAVAHFMSLSEYVCGLRRCEGFEMPAAEGLMCGARPILFDQPHYRRWYGDFAEYIQEGSVEDVTVELAKLFNKKPRPVTASERGRAAEVFSWPAIVGGLWGKLKPFSGQTAAPAPARVTATGRKRLLLVGDAGVETGFGRAMHQIAKAACEHYDVQVVGINYFGDPDVQAKYPFPIYPPRTAEGGDMFGIKRMVERATKFRPDLICIQQDVWNFPPYMQALQKAGVQCPVMGIAAVDGLNCRGRALRDLAMTVFWTEFGRNEAVKGGYEGSSTVIPLGVDLEIYKPHDRKMARQGLGLGQLGNTFIFGCVNRNQLRKRMDLLVQYFCEWLEFRRHDAYLYIHSAPTGDDAFDIEQLMEYYVPKGMGPRLIFSTPDIGQGIPEQMLGLVYSAFNVGVSTTQGEGWGLTTMEGMACGIPQIVPDWSALGEWAKGAAMLVECPTRNTTDRQINSIGGVPDKDAFIGAMDVLYDNRESYDFLVQQGRELVSCPGYRWENICQRYIEVFQQVLSGKATVAA